MSIQEDTLLDLKNFAVYLNIFAIGFNSYQLFELLNSVLMYLKHIFFSVTV